MRTCKSATCVSRSTLRRIPNVLKAHISPASRAQFLRDVKAFQKATGKSVENVIEMVAVSAGQQLMAKTLPVGTKATGKPPSGEAFQHSITAQIYRALKKNIDRVRGGESVAAIHKSARGSVGVVVKSPRDERNSQIPLPSDAVRNEAVQHVRKMTHRAGLAKAAWLTASYMIGRPSKSTVPAYVRRHINKARGEGSRRGSGIRNFTVTLSNMVAHMNQRLCPPRLMQQALNIAYGVVRWELDKVLNGGKPKRITLRKKRV